MAGWLVCGNRSHRLQFFFKKRKAEKIIMDFYIYANQLYVLPIITHLKMLANVVEKSTVSHRTRTEPWKTLIIFICVRE